MISICLSPIAGFLLASGLWAQAALLLRKKKAVRVLFLKYSGVILFLVSLWIYPAGLILDTVLFFSAAIGSLIVGSVFKKYW